MKDKSPFAMRTVILLTVLCHLLLNGCAYINDHYGESCNSRAYVRSILADHISTRFHSNAPVRMAVIPFTAPANLSAYSNERPGLGNELAWKVQAELLKSTQIPIVEVLNRQDWPGKREEFYTGNFGALSIAREAGYDLVMIGMLDNPQSNDSMAIFTKIIEVESGITLWYGRSGVVTYRGDFRVNDTTLLWDKTIPALTYTAPQIEMLARCVSHDVTSEEVVR